MPLVEQTVASDSNAFFMNALIMRNTSQVSPHLDCSLDTYLGVHTPPRRVSVVYTQVPDDLEGGELELHGLAEPIVRIVPRTGMLVQFPGATVHAVSAVRPTSVRISLGVEEYRLEPDASRCVPSFAVGVPPRCDATAERLLSLVRSLSREEQAALRALDIADLRALLDGIKQ